MSAQEHLSKHKSIVLPRLSETLWIVTDGSVTKRGLSATLYVTCDSHLYLAGFYSAKLQGHQVTWLPCEVETSSIAAAVKHFSPFIIQAQQHTTVSTDSKPCVQAIEKLCRANSWQPLEWLPFSRLYQVTKSVYNVWQETPTFRLPLPVAMAPTAVSLIAKSAPLSTKWKTQSCVTSRLGHSRREVQLPVHHKISMATDPELLPRPPKSACPP